MGLVAAGVYPHAHVVGVAYYVRFWGPNTGAFTVGLAATPPSAGPIRHDVVMGATVTACAPTVILSGARSA